MEIHNHELFGLQELDIYVMYELLGSNELQELYMLYKLHDLLEFYKIYGVLDAHGIHKELLLVV